MKPFTFFLAVVSLLIASCSGGDKAQVLVKKYLDTTLNDPESYKPVKFSKVNSTKSILEDDNDYQMAKINIDLETKSWEDWKMMNPDYDGTGDLEPSRVAYFEKKVKEHYSKAETDLKALHKAENNFVPKFVGYHILHTYRAKNGFGVLKLTIIRFELDSSLTRVISSSTQNGEN